MAVRESSARSLDRVLWCLDKYQKVEKKWDESDNPDKGYWLGTERDAAREDLELALNVLIDNRVIECLEQIQALK